MARVLLLTLFLGITYAQSQSDPSFIPCKYLQTNYMLLYTQEYASVTRNKSIRFGVTSNDATTINFKQC